MLLDVTLTVVGLAALVGGAAVFVRSASAIAATLGLSPVIVGATVVAFGTSAPEFLVATRAAVSDSGSLAVGSVLGSNVTNVAVVLGIAAVVRPLPINRDLLRWELPVLVAGTIAFALLARSGTLGHLGGAAMFLGLLAFVGFSLRVRPRSGAGPGVTRRGEDAAARIAGELALLAVGVVALAGGAYVAVLGATGVALAAGVSELAIGATVVAVGTSLPEIAASTIAAARGHHEIAVANVIGSNIFNLLGVIGLAGAIGTLPVESGLYRFEIPALAASTAVLVLLAWPRARAGRVEGIALVAAYAAFVGVVLARGGTA